MIGSWGLGIYSCGLARLGLPDHTVYPLVSSLPPTSHPTLPTSIHRSVPFGSLCSPHVPSLSSTPNPSGSIPSLTMFAHSSTQRNYPWKIECFLEDLFLGGQSSIILGYRRLSVKSGKVNEGLGRDRLVGEVWVRSAHAPTPGSTRSTNPFSNPQGCTVTHYAHNLQPHLPMGSLYSPIVP